jgi:NADH-quinone oxidoreductase subunit H
MIVALFLGGWHLPFVPGLQIGDVSIWAFVLKMLIYGAKIAFFLFLFMWVRWTLPRFRFDQLMRLSWKGLMPMSLALMIYTSVLTYAGKQTSVLWCLGGELAIVVIALALGAARTAPITGRQRNMPAISVPT